jgi:hypothetical protein
MFSNVNICGIKLEKHCTNYKINPLTLIHVFNNVNTLT